MIAASIFVVALGSGIAMGETFSQSDENLYADDFDLKLNQSENEAQVKFDNRSVDLYLESWEQFRVYYDNGRYSERIPTESTGELETASTIVTVAGASYRFSFRYVDRPDTTEGDYFTLYRIVRIQ